MVKEDVLYIDCVFIRKLTCLLSMTAVQDFIALVLSHAFQDICYFLKLILKY
jgi:hypothetical protein